MTFIVNSKFKIILEDGHVLLNNYRPSLNIELTSGSLGFPHLNLGVPDRVKGLGMEPHVSRLLPLPLQSPGKHPTGNEGLHQTWFEDCVLIVVMANGFDVTYELQLTGRGCGVESESVWVNRLH